MKTMIMKKFIFLMFMTCVATSGVAQDKLASMAPVDKKMRTIDSLSIVRLLFNMKSLLSRQHLHFIPSGTMFIPLIMV